MTLRVTCLGTSGAVPTTQRNPSSLLCNREGERLLFDAGEGTQRQMMRFGTGFDVSGVFITHTHGDHVLGLPGLIQTWSFNERTRKLRIYTPQGTRQAVEELVHAGETTPSFPVEISTVSPGQRVLDTEAYTLRAVRTSHRVPSVGYALHEAERNGRFDREKAESLGVPVGPKFSTLHEGRSVELEDGTIVEPEQVVGEPRPGRSVVYTGDTLPTDAVIDAAENADLLIHDATFTDADSGRAKKTGHSTAREAGEVAESAGVERLVLTHISSRYAGSTGRHRSEASEVFDGTVTVATDGDEFEVSLAE